MKDAQIDDPADVHFVQIKCPLLTAQKVQDAAMRGHKTATQDTLKSMGLSRAASALGVAVALGEIPRASIRDEDIGARLVALVGPRELLRRHRTRTATRSWCSACRRNGRAISRSTMR